MDKESRQKFLQARRDGLGGSDIAAILGIESSFKTRFQVWDEKVNGTHDEPSNQQALMLGNILEYPLINKYQDMTGKIVKRLADTITKKKYPYFIANIDGHIPEEKRIIEVKTANEFTRDKWGPCGSQQIPEHYYAQIAHYMLVLDYQYADLIVGFITKSIKDCIDSRIMKAYLERDLASFNDIPELMEVRMFSFERNKEIDEIIIKEGTFFWENYVLKKEPPEKDYKNKRFFEYIKESNKEVSDGKVVYLLDENMLNLKNKYVELCEKSSKIEDEKTEIKSIILDTMKDAQIAKFKDGDFFERKIIQRKDSYIKASEYVKFALKKGNESE